MPALPRPHLFFLLTVLALLPIFVYVHSLGNEFVNWDDGPLILENPWIQGLSWVNIRHAFTSYDPELYIPFTLLSYQLNYAVADLQPWIYHLTNLLLHTGNVLLVFTIANLLTRRRFTALATALLFAVHPLHTEAIVWAAARKDVLSGTFLLMTIAGFLQFREAGKRRWYLLSVVSFGCGLLSKISIIPGPLLLMLIDWLQGRTSFRRSLRGAVPFFGLSILFGIVSLFGKITNSSFLYEKILIGAKAAMFLLIKLAVPWGLAPLYPYTQPIILTSPDLFFSVAGVVALTVLCLWSIRWSRWPLFAWMFFLLFLLPSLSNMAKGRNELLDVYVTSDRYTYVGSLGPLLLAGLFFDGLRQRWQWVGIAAPTAVAVIFSVLAYRQSLFWKDSEALFTHTLAVSPNAYIAHQNLGTIAVRRGDIDEGLRRYTEVLKIRTDAVTYYNIGLIMEYRGDKAAAIEAYRQAVKTSPLEEEAAMRLRVLEGSAQ